MTITREFILSGNQFRVRFQGLEYAFKIVHVPAGDRWPEGWLLRVWSTSYRWMPFGKIDPFTGDHFNTEPNMDKTAGALQKVLWYVWSGKTVK